MPKTDVEWQALDARIAREVMGWLTWDEVSEDAQRAYWIALDLEGDAFNTAYCDQQWWEKGKRRWPSSVETVHDWQPHKDAAQAVMVKNKIMSQGWRFEMRGFPSLICSASFWQPGGCQFMGDANSDAEAICLAAEQWMNGQKEAQDV